MHLPSNPAITMLPGGESITYEQLSQQVQELTSSLQSLGLKEGDKIAFMLGNQIEFAVVMQAAREGGFDHLPLNTHSKAEEIHQILAQLDPAAVIVGNQFSSAAATMTKKLKPSVCRIMTGTSAAAGWQHYRTLLDEHAGTTPSPAETGRRLLLSGGSTGAPKIVVKAAGKKVTRSNAKQTLTALSPTSNDAVLIPAPLYHAMPIGWLDGALNAGAHVIVMEQRGGEDILRAVNAFGVTMLPLTPTMMGRMLEVPNREQYDMSSLRMVLHGGAPCKANVKQAFMDWVGCVWETYGMAEGFGVCIQSPDGWRQKPGSVGKPIGSSRVVIRDESGRELPAGEVGIVWFARPKGGHMAYLGRQKETDECYNEHGEGTALDNGYLDKDGYLFLVGRSKNMLTVGGVNVFPARIEEVLGRDASVADVCVVGIQHGDLGEVPAAVIELAPSAEADENLKRSLAAQCHEMLGRLSTPQRWMFVTKIPRTETGKVQLADIRAMVNN